MTISETDSQKPRRGRPRSWRWEWANDRRSLCPEELKCARSRLNWTLCVTACGLAKTTLTPDEQTILFGVPWEQIGSHNGGAFPRGWPSVAYELGRLVDMDKEYAVECLRGLVDARRRGVSWGGCRAVLRTMRLGRRDGSSVSLLIALSRTVDAYRRQFPATTDRQIVASCESLLDTVRTGSEQEIPG